MQTIAPGALHLEQYLSWDEQVTVARRCLEIGAGAAGFYTPIVRGGHPMSVRMLCLGRHWNARTYSYEDLRSDIDGLPVPPLPPDLAALAQRAGADAGFSFAPDLCIVNWYSATSRMGLHQDKDESEGSLARGAPVVSLSIGDAAWFLFGGAETPRSCREAEAGIGRCLRVRRPGTAALPRRLTHRARHGAAGPAVRRPSQPDVSRVLTACLSRSAVASATASRRSARCT